MVYIDPARRCHNLFDHHVFDLNLPTGILNPKILNVFQYSCVISYFAGRLWMVSASLVSKKFGFWPFSQYVVGEKVKEIIQSYSLQLEFPTRGSKEFEMLSDNLQRKVKKFNEGPYQDILQWLKSFDRDNTHALTDYKKYIVTKKPLIFLEHTLTAIIDEMGEIAFDILDETAKNAQNDDDSD